LRRLDAIHNQSMAAGRLPDVGPSITTPLPSGLHDVSKTSPARCSTPLGSRARTGVRWVNESQGQPDGIADHAARRPRWTAGTGKLQSSLTSDAAVTTGVDTRLMMRNVAQLSGALLLRAWVEGDSSYGLRVRIIRIHPSGETSTMSARTIEATCDMVENWLGELLRAGTPHAQPPPVTRT